MIRGVRSMVLAVLVAGAPCAFAQTRPSTS